MTDCIFCKIIDGEIPSTQVYKDGLVTAFRDINPAALIHVLIVPNKHIPTVNDLTIDDEQLVGHLFTVAKQISEEEGISESGYRMIVNTGSDGHQEVFHIHMHLLGGQSMKYPMG